MTPCTPFGTNSKIQEPLQLVKESSWLTWGLCVLHLLFFPPFTTLSNQDPYHSSGMTNLGKDIHNIADDSSSITVIWHVSLKYLGRELRFRRQLRTEMCDITLKKICFFFMEKDMRISYWGKLSEEGNFQFPFWVLKLRKYTGGRCFSNIMQS